MQLREYDIVTQVLCYHLVYASTSSNSNSKLVTTTTTNTTTMLLTSILLASSVSVTIRLLVLVYCSNKLQKAIVDCRSVGVEW